MFAIKSILSRLIIATLAASIISGVLYYFRVVPKATTKPEIALKSTPTKTSSRDFRQNTKIDKKPRFTAKVNLNTKVSVSNFEIDKGELDGIVVGNVITDSDNRVVGLVAKTQAKTSIVNTLPNIKTNLPVVIGSLKNKGLLTGLYGYSAEVNWLQNGLDLENQPIYTSNFSKNTQADLLIGFSQNAQLGKSGSFYRVDVADLSTAWQTNQDVLVW